MSNTPKVRFAGFTGDWEKRKVADIASDTRGGGTPKTSNEAYWTGDIPWIQSSDLTEGKVFGVEPRKHISMAGLNSSATQLVPEDSIAVVTRVGVGKLAYMPYSYTTSQDFLSLCRLQTEPIFTVYGLYQMLQGELSAVQGTSIKGMTKEDLLSKTISAPKSSDEQARIGAYFKRLDNLITLHQCEYEKLVSLKSACLDKMFPKNGSKAPELRFAGFTGDWEQRKLGDMMNVTSVKRIHQSDWTDSGIRFLRARDVVAAAKGEEPSDLLYISKEKYEECSALSGKVAIDDLLVTGVGTIGIPYLISNSEPLYFKDGNIIWFHNCGKIIGKFFYYSFTGEQIQSFIKDSAGIGTVGTYTIESGKKTPILLPEIEEQRKLGAFFADLDTLITLQQRKLEKLKQLKQSMLYSMFV